MINRVRNYVLSGSSECVERLLSKMEALERISSIEQVKDVWDRNRVPYMSDDDVARGKLGPMWRNFIRVPDEILSKEDPGTEFIKFCYERGFEPGEFITGKKYDTALDACFLCELAHYKGMANNPYDYDRLAPKQVDMIIYQSPNFYVTSEAGALSKGYLMIVPKDHHMSVAQFPKELFPEYHEVMEDVETILQGAYGKGKAVTFWEHGSGPSGISSHKKSIVHAHTHVIVDFQIKPKYLEMVQMKPLEDITKASGTHYFSYQEGSHGQLLCCYDDRVYVQRQFPRQILAAELGFAPGQYNWRKVSFKENVMATLYRLFCYLSDTKAKDISERVRVRTKAFVDAYPQREDNLIF